MKDGAIIPVMQNVLMHAPAPDEKVDLEIRYYGTKAGTYRLYDDDGLSFDYEKGAYSWRKICVAKDKNGQLAGRISAPEKGKPNTVGKVTFRFMTNNL